MAGSPTARRRRLAIELKKLREDHGLTCNQVGESLDWSGSKVNRMETGQGRVQPSDIEALCRFYNTTDELRELLKDLAKHSKMRGWWHAYGSAVPTWFSVYVGLEQAACSLRTYEAEFVPGLLQTADYARELHHATAQPSPDDVEQMIAVRMERQALLTAPQAPDLWAILHESVLRHVIGSRSVMQAQFERLLKMAQLKNVTVQVLPFNSGSYPATGAYTMLGFPEQEDPDIVYRDGLTDAVYLEQPSDIAQYAKAFDNLRALSLSPQQSSALITEAMQGLT
ncbi:MULTISPECIES: helix-turn-helix transcriptional regulator [unclassified Streptomyces]|uniref:helix-turn-helix domain-containing protein n=1 Tax=unclassified Streptomyces TaxID=2593676 RepID=UPI000883368D|nr:MULTISPECIES: helix-turn-helix transcriptional regulator [unclassified Streptomyces]PBC83330.1 helix-turn-helix protein [Streptomyces sp. 2321.6]SDR43335.1 Helix-turn-helix domain-containing protein [Streptomyces sp. KS_16]SEC92708.1 Helix-turn-helix domain-containing protein [Streptomyces sp. 2133.1]SEE80672.1 Helix-turn-helix domain-containing protein [Streptomyces sp. 2112.3]SNC69408.1 Helix-turn-helix domain-containing protein [Streptomyces sp. 2114.4]